MKQRIWARAVRFVFDNSILLLVGTVAAVAWANLDTAGYDHATHPLHFWVGSSRVDLQACKLEYSIVSPK